MHKVKALAMRCLTRKSAEDDWSGEEIYEGQESGIHSRNNDLTVNVKSKAAH